MLTCQADSFFRSHVWQAFSALTSAGTLHTVLVDFATKTGSIFQEEIFVDASAAFILSLAGHTVGEDRTAGHTPIILQEGIKWCALGANSRACTFLTVITDSIARLTSINMQVVLVVDAFSAVRL